MSGRSLLSTVLFVGSVMGLLILLEVLAHRSIVKALETKRPSRADSTLTSLLLAMFGAFLCLVALLLLLPWAASLSSQGSAGLQIGIPLAILLFVGMLHASTQTSALR